MKIAKELCIILGISFLGEALGKLLPFPVPASIYGMVLLLIALMSGVLKLEQVEKAADGLLDMMPLLFVPAGAGLINNLTEIRQFLLPILLILFLTTAIVMAVSGKVAGILIAHRKRKAKKDGNALS